MKKLLTLIAIALITVGGWFVFKNRSDSAPEVKLEQATTRPSPKNATFIFEDGPVTLKDGKATVTSPDGFIPTDTSLSDEMAYGEINDDGKNDAAVILIQNSGGSGVFIFVAAYVSGNVAYKGTNAVFVGDRVSPQSLKINTDGTVTLTYLDRRPDEPMAAAPTIQKTRRYELRAGELEEI